MSGGLLERDGTVAQEGRYRCSGGTVPLPTREGTVAQEGRSGPFSKRSPKLDFGHFWIKGKPSRETLGSEMPPLICALGCGVAPG